MTSETEVKQEPEPSPDSVVPERTSDVGAAVWRTTERIARWVGHQLTQARTRTFVVGAVLILVAALFVGHSFWTAPLVIIGVVMILVAWVGSRLEGRFAIEWSEFGTGFEMHARFKSSAASAQQLTGPSSPAPDPKLPEGQLGHGDDVIDGEAHTMEIPVEELRAIVAAIEHAAPLANLREDLKETHSPVPSTSSTSSTSGANAPSANGTDTPDTAPAPLTTPAP